MAGLVDAQTHRDCGVIREAPLSRSMEICAPLYGSMQVPANMHVVVEVTEPRTADPAMRMLSLRPQLVRWQQPHLSELVVQTVLPRKETR